MDKKLRILVLEDVPADAALVERELRKGGIAFLSKRVETEEAFTRGLNEFKPDIVLADYNLPSFNGPAAISIVKQKYPDLPILLVSGTVGEDIGVEMLKIGAWDYILKGRLSRLVPSVRRALKEADDLVERKRLQEALWTSAREWRATFDAVNYPLALMDLEGRILRCNKAMASLLGKSFNEIIGRNCCPLLHGKPGPLEGCPVVRLRESQRRETLLLTVGNRWFNIVADPLLDEDGSLIGAVHIMSDITESKKAEEELRDSEERFHLAFENANIGVCLVDLEGRLSRVNHQMCEIFGYRREELEGMTVNDIAHPEDMDTSPTFIQRAISGEIQHVNFEKRYFHKDGHIVWGQISSSLVRGAHGVPQYFISHVQDITERKRAEEALLQAEKSYRSIFENAIEGIFRSTPEGRYISANPAQARMFGYESPEDLITNITDAARQIFAESERRQEYRRLLEEHGVVKGFEFQACRKDGSKIWISSNIRTVCDGTGAVIYYEGTSEDITERKRAEEIVKQSEKNARQVAQENAVMAEIGRIVSSTLNIDEIYESFSMEVKKLIPFDRIVINIIDTEEGTVKNVYIAGEGVRDRNTRDVYPLEGSGNAEMFRTKSTLLIQAEDFNEYKDRFPMLLSTFQAGFRSIMNVPLFSKGEMIGGLLLRSRKPHAYTEKEVRVAERIGFQIAGAIANAQLYTERIQAEEEKAALQEQLRQSQKMEAIGRLAGGIAHDFNNLLTVIKGYSQLSLLELKEGDPLGGNIEEITRAADRAADLTRQLLAFSRRQILEMRVLDLNTVLRDLDKMLRRVIGEDIELVTLLAEDLGRVKTDPGQVQQVIMNLGVNARDAMPSGGKLTIETANVELDREYANAHVAVTPGRYVMLSVSDTGVGMTPEVKERLFEPFFTTKEKGKGTGLGLSTVYGIVKQSGGNIWVYSEPGQGTTFKVYLPRVDEPPEELKQEGAAREKLPLGSETILVVEDEKEVRKLAVRILKNHGYEVLEGANGEEALAICREWNKPIHLMITDVVMPGMSGRALANRLMALHPEMKVAYMSGYTDNAIVHHGVLEPGMNYIQKPFTIEGLARKVREVLDK